MHPGRQVAEQRLVGFEQNPKTGLALLVRSNDLPGACVSHSGALRWPQLLQRVVLLSGGSQAISAHTKCARRRQRCLEKCLRRAHQWAAHSKQHIPDVCTMFVLA